MKVSIFGIAAAAALAASGLAAQPTPEFPPTHALHVKPTPPPPSTKISGTLECEKPERTSMDVADAPGHVLTSPLEHPSDGRKVVLHVDDDHRGSWPVSHLRVQAAPRR